MALCRYVLLSSVLVAGRAAVGAMDLHEQSLMEAVSPLRGGMSVNEVKLTPVPAEILHTPQFSSLLSAYTEDTALERALGECRLWIDVNRYKTDEAIAQSPWLAPETTKDRELRDFVSSLPNNPGPNAIRGQCANLNKRFGWSPRRSLASLETPLFFAICTEAPWFAEIEVIKVDADEANEFNRGHLHLHVKYTSQLPAAFSSKMPSTIPVAPSQILIPAGHDSAGPLISGEKATVFCLQKGQPLLLSRHAENETAHLEFLPGPWSVEVDVELYADVSRPMGVGARLRLRDNVAITIPPSRLLPITTEGIKAEQWLLLELAELHAQQQRQSRATDARETHELDRMELWDKLQRERALEAFAPRQCRLKRGERFGDPVELDCLPDIRGQRKRELVMDGLDVVRRGVIGLVLAMIPTLGLNAAFHSLIRSNDRFVQRAEKAAPELSIFNLKRECRVSFPVGVSGRSKEAKKSTDIALRGWDPKQMELLDTIASEMLQLYAKGGKDRRKHRTEGAITFIESDDRLVIYVPVTTLSNKRRITLGLLFQSEAELIFTFEDVGGHFRPFHKVLSMQGETSGVNGQQGIARAARDAHPSQGIRENPTDETVRKAEQTAGKETSAPEAATQDNTGHEGAEPADGSTGGQPSKVATASVGAQVKKIGDLGVPAVANDKHGSEKEGGEGRITYLQLLWQKVGEPQHRELKRTAVGNIVWDVWLSAAFLLMAYLTTKLVGSVNGRTVADMLRERRSLRLSSLRAGEIDVTASFSSESHTHEASFDMNLGMDEDTTVAEGIETNDMLKATP